MHIIPICHTDNGEDNGGLMPLFKSYGGECLGFVWQACRTRKKFAVYWPTGSVYKQWKICLYTKRRLFGYSPFAKGEMSAGCIPSFAALC